MIAQAVDIAAPAATVITDPGELDIVAALQVAPRVPASALAEILNQPATTVSRRLNKLQRERIVRVIGRFAWPLALSGNPMQLWICCQPGRSYEVAERLKEFTEIQFDSVTSGNADIYADVYPLLGFGRNELMHGPNTFDTRHRLRPEPTGPEELTGWGSPGGCRG